MESHLQSPLVFLLLIIFLLVRIHGADSRKIQLPVYHHHEDEEDINKIFFHLEDLKPGNSIPFYFPTRNPNKTPKFLPREISDALPFSLSHLPSVLQALGIDPESPQAKSMAETLIHCDSPPVSGESKFCATSLESMMDSIRTGFPSGSRPKLLATSPRVRYDGVQMFRVLEDPREVGAPNAMACHPMPYPYAVFYCHGQRGRNKVYEVETETERDGAPVRVRIMGICHMDTSDWDPKHVAFPMLGIRPGEGPVCHASPPDTLLWLPTSLK